MINLEKHSVECYICDKECKGKDTVYSYRDRPFILFFCSISCLKKYLIGNRKLKIDNADHVITSKGRN